MPRNIVRERLETLFNLIVKERLIESCLSAGRALPEDELLRYDIRREGFDIECLDDATHNLAVNPPILFQSMPQVELDNHPIDLSDPDLSPTEQQELMASMAFHDRDPDRQTPGWSAADHSMFIHEYSWRWAEGDDRPTLMTPTFGYFLTHRRLRDIARPDPFFAHGGVIEGVLPSLKREFECLSYLEPEKTEPRRIHPHLILGVTHSFDGEEGSMLYGELVTIIEAMHRRANQPHVANEESVLVYFDDLRDYLERNDVDRLPREFGSERRFPVLLVSYLPSQRARIFYACMDRTSLVIRQSRLYNFQRKIEPNLDLFARLILSQPLRETGV